MAVGLGKIAKHAPARRIELFRQQPHVVAAGEQPLKQPLSIFIAALQNVIVRKPKRRPGKPSPGGEPSLELSGSYRRTNSSSMSNLSSIARSVHKYRIIRRKKPVTGRSSSFRPLL